MKQFFNKLMSNLSSVFKNGGKNWSSVRFAFIIAVMLSNFAFWGVWTCLSIAKKDIYPVPESVIVIYCLANGIAVSSKLGQKPMEKKANEV